MLLFAIMMSRCMHYMRAVTKQTEKKTFCMADRVQKNINEFMHGNKYKREGFSNIWGFAI